MIINKIKIQSGFTLIEMSLSLMIIGLVIGTAFSLYMPYLEKKKVEITEDRLEDVYAALEEFKTDRGFYPCPAPLSAARGTANYGFPGQPQSCFDTATVAPGSCEPTGAYCIRQGSRPDLLPATPDRRVRIGAIPFRELNLSERQTYDGYKSRFYYAVTESMARDSASYSLINGMVNIQDTLGESLTDPAGSAKFIIFSPGLNKIGAYNLNGQLVSSCTAPYSGIDIQNCRTNAVNAVFLAAQKSDEGLANEMDDMIAFDYSAFNQSLEGWRLGSVSNGENINDVYTDRSVVVGDVSQNPRYEVDITGSQQDLRANNTVIAETSLCDYDDSDPNAPPTDCLRVANLERTCPPGEYVTGLGPTSTSPGTFTCSPILLECPENEMIVGVANDGSAICSPIPPPPPGSPPVTGPPPPLSCGTTQTRNLNCPPPQTGQYQEFRSYDCDNNVWVTTGNNRSVQCCSLSATPADQVWTATATYRRSWLCGNYGVGTRTRSRTLNSANCSYSNGPSTYNCSCIPNGTGRENPVGYDSSRHNILTCAIREREYYMTGNRCNGRTDLGIVDNGTFEDATFVWTLDGAIPDSVSTISSSTRKAGDVCSMGSSQSNCASRNPVNSNGEHRFYRNCSCTKRDKPGEPNC